MDLASSEKERSDYTAVVEWWEDAENNLYAIGAYQARLDEGHRLWLTGVDDDGEIPPGNERNLLSGPRFLWPCELLPPSAAIAGHHQKAPRPLTTLKIEAVTFQSTFVRELLAKTRLPASAVHPDKDKVTRARTLAARMEAGKVFFLRGAPGIEMLKAQMTAFPNGEHDDLVDAAVYGADLGGSDFYFTSGNR
jgi:predicted phage terminase large subunit-like protein